MPPSMPHPRRTNTKSSEINTEEQNFPSLEGQTHIVPKLPRSLCWLHPIPFRTYPVLSPATPPRATPKLWAHSIQTVLGAPGQVFRLSLPGSQGRAQTHPVSGAEALHDHCRAERAGWVHGAASEVDLDRERQVVRRATCLSTLKGLVSPRVTQKFRGSTRSLTQVSWFLGW